MNKNIKKIWLMMLTLLNFAPSHNHAMTLHTVPEDIAYKIIGHIADDSKSTNEAKKTLHALLRTNRLWKARILANKEDIIKSLDEKKMQAKKDVIDFLSIKCGTTIERYEVACLEREWCLRRFLNYKKYINGDLFHCMRVCDNILKELHILINEYVRNKNFSTDHLDAFFTLHGSGDKGYIDAENIKAFKKLYLIDRATCAQISSEMFYEYITSEPQTLKRQRIFNVLTMLHDHNLFHPYTMRKEQINNFLHSKNCSKADAALCKKLMNDCTKDYIKEKFITTLKVTVLIPAFYLVNKVVISFICKNFNENSPIDILLLGGATNIAYIAFALHFCTKSLTPKKLAIAIKLGLCIATFESFVALMVL